MGGTLWYLGAYSKYLTSRAQEHTIIKPPETFISHVLWNMFIQDDI
jgi:hypothetical protein